MHDWEIGEVTAIGTGRDPGNEGWLLGNKTWWLGTFGRPEASVMRLQVETSSGTKHNYAPWRRMVSVGTQATKVSKIQFV